MAYPLDVIRRRMQLEGLQTRDLFRYTSTRHAVSKILAHSGFRGLYIGLSINYIKVAPAVSISFVTYETMKSLLGV